MDNGIIDKETEVKGKHNQKFCSSSSSDDLPETSNTVMSLKPNVKAGSKYKVKTLSQLKNTAVEDPFIATPDDLQSISDLSSLLNFTGLNENESFYLTNQSLVDLMNITTDAKNNSPQVNIKNMKKKEQQQTTNAGSLNIDSVESVYYEYEDTLNSSPAYDDTNLNTQTKSSTRKSKRSLDFTTTSIIEKRTETEEPQENKNKNSIKTITRTWDRKNACIYCEQLVTNFSRHIIRNHKNEIEVLQYLSINDPDPKIKKLRRQKITDELRNRGNFKHNSTVAYEREGLLLPRKRNNMQTNSPSNFVNCKNCLGTYKRSTFYRHFKKCGRNITVQNYSTGSNNNRVLRNHAVSIIPNDSAASKELTEHILPRLRNDEVSLIIQTDPLIIAFGSRLLRKMKERRSRKAICSRMRDLATLLKIVKEKDNTIKTLKDLIDPNKYETFIEAVKCMCGFNEETGFVKIISIPARIRPAILGCAEILFTQIIISQYHSTAYKEAYKKKIEDFKYLLEINWQWEISSNAEKTRKRLNMTKEAVLPLDEDIEKLTKKIHQLEEKYCENLKKDVNVIFYEQLCEVTIAHIILLDRKRSGDVAEAELTFYINRKIEPIPEKILNILTSKQKQCVDKLDIFQIPGKRTRSVPILLTKGMRENIDLIISCRPVLKIPTTNPYLFARPMTSAPFDGGKCLDKIKRMCSLKKPEMLTSTGMRHHIATMSQIEAKQNDPYTEHLAGFLGHDMAVHSKNYRLPLQVIQKAVVGSKLMEYENYGLNSKNNKASDKMSRITETITSTDLKNTETMYKYEKESTEGHIVQSTNLRIEIENITQGYDDEKKNAETTLSKSIDRREEQIELMKKTEQNEQPILHGKKEEPHNMIKLAESSEKNINTKKFEQNVTKNQTKIFQSDVIIPNENLCNIDRYSASLVQRTASNITKDKKKVLRKRKICNPKNQDLADSTEEAKCPFNDIETDESDYEMNKYEKDYPSSEDSEADATIQIKRRKVSHTKWSEEEIKVVKKLFKENIENKCNPGKAKCSEVIKKEPILHKRTWMQLNTYVNNIYKKKCK